MNFFGRKIEKLSRRFARTRNRNNNNKFYVKILFELYFKIHVTLICKSVEIKNGL